MTKLPGALALVTGASAGIGRATAVALAARGARLVLLGRDPQRLADLGRRLDGEVIAADLADLVDRDEPDDRARDEPDDHARGDRGGQPDDGVRGGQPDDLAELVERILRDGIPDLVVHNAGAGLAGPVVEQRPADVDRVLRLNLVAPMALTRALLPAMLQRGSGHLVFVTSIAGLLGVADEAAYAASKAGLGAFATSLRGEVAGRGVRVTTVAPGVVDTDFFSRRGTPYARRLPRPIRPERVADRIVHAVEHDRAQVIVPGWLRVPVAMQSVAPETYARLASRWG